MDPERKVKYLLLKKGGVLWPRSLTNRLRDKDVPKSMGKGAGFGNPGAEFLQQEKGLVLEVKG